MKKIRCNWVHNDYIKIELADDTHPVRDVIIRVESSDEGCVRLSPEKICKLRKQLKRALVEIEGEKCKKAQAEEYKPGDRVYLLPWGNECHLSSIAAQDIDLGKPVVLSELNGDIGFWSFEYTKLDGITQSTGFAYEKSFGPRA